MKVIVTFPKLEFLSFQKKNLYKKNLKSFIKIFDMSFQNIENFVVSYAPRKKNDRYFTKNTYLRGTSQKP